MWIDKITDLLVRVPALAYATIVVALLAAAAVPVTLWQFAKRVRRVTVSRGQRTVAQVHLETEKVQLPTLVLDAVVDPPDRRAS